MRVFPPRNLPGPAEDWGRHVETRVEGLDGSNERLSQTTENSGRFTGGQLAVFSDQVSEQLDRSTVRIDGGIFSVTGSGKVEPFPRATKVLPFTAPSGGRNAQVEFYGTYTLSAPGDVGLYGYLSYEGSILTKFSNSQITTDGRPSFTSDPWMFKGLANVRLPDSGAGSFSLTLIRVGFTGATSTETLTDISIYVTPFQKTQ